MIKFQTLIINMWYVKNQNSSDLLKYLEYVSLHYPRIDIIQPIAYKYLSNSIYIIIIIITKIMTVIKIF